MYVLWQLHTTMRKNFRIPVQVVQCRPVISSDIHLNPNHPKADQFSIFCGEGGSGDLSCSHGWIKCAIMTFHVNKQRHVDDRIGSLAVFQHPLY